MIRLFYSRLFIFGKNSFRAFQRYVALCRKCTPSKITKEKKYLVIPKSYLRAHIFGSTNDNDLEKTFFWSINKLQSIYIYCFLWFQTLILDMLICLNWVHVIYTEKESYRKLFVTCSWKRRKCSIDEHSWYFKYSYMM